MRFTKLKTSNLSGSVAHVARKLNTPNANPDLKNKNITVGSPEAIQAILDRVKAVTGGKYRKDAVVAYEFVLTAKSEWFATKSSREVNQWGNASLEWIRNTFGKDNMISATLHLDEAAPHLHVYVVPEFKGRLCAKAYTGTKKLCSDLQTGYANAVKRFGLERGLKGSKAVHIPPKQFHALVNNQEIPELPGRLASTTTREEYEQSICMLLAKQKAEAMRFAKANEKLSKLVSIIGNRDFNQVNEALNELETLQKSNEKHLSELTQTQQQLEEINQSFQEWQEVLSDHQIRTPGQLNTTISTAKTILKREQELTHSTPTFGPR